MKKRTERDEERLKRQKVSNKRHLRNGKKKRQDMEIRKKTDDSPTKIKRETKRSGKRAE